MDEAIARALHVIGVILWIGGVAMITAVVLPAFRSGAIAGNPVKGFEAVERRFSIIARLSILIVGVTGFYMTYTLDLWDRFAVARYWWMHAMVLVWLVFTLVVFIAEPLYLHEAFRRWANSSPKNALNYLVLAHYILLTLSIVTVFGAIYGSHYGFFFL